VQATYNLQDDMTEAHF